MSDEKDTPGGTRPLHDELFDGPATEPLTAPADDTRELPSSTADDDTLALPSAPPAPSVPAPDPARSVPAPDPARSVPVPDPSAAREPSRGPRVATIVWGFVLFALGAAVLAVALGADLDVDLAAIVVLVVAGVTLVVGSVVTSVRRRGHG